MNAPETWTDLMILVRCPVTGSQLHLASDALLDELQRAAQAAGRPPIEVAFVNQDESLAYPVLDQIPALVPSEKIELQNGRVRHEDPSADAADN